MLLVCNSELLHSKRIFLKQSSSLLLAIPLILAAYTHLWNPIGFPAIQADEYKYVRRALHVLNGLGPQDPASRFDHGQIQGGGSTSNNTKSSSSSYDHPYFGQIFLAGVFNLIGYPGSLNPTSDYDLHSIEMLYLLPRVLMGTLSIIDTFLIYKIAKRRYSETVGFIASMLFAVMPITWILRWILLDSIQLPFLLSSILFAVYYNKNKDQSSLLTQDTARRRSGDNNKDKNNNQYKQVISVLCSGIFLGLAIFTKIPAFTMIPLVGYLIFIDNKDNRKWKRTFLIWFIPVVLIPAIWPAYALLAGQFDEWVAGVLYQATERQATAGSRTLYNALNIFFQIDPVLLVVGIAGIVLAALKKDYLILLWTIPYFIFLYLAGWVIYFHLIPLLPVFCISSALLIVNLSKKIVGGGVGVTTTTAASKKKGQVILRCILICAIPIFGIIITSIMILTITNASSYNIEAAAFVVKKALGSNSNSNNNSNSYKNSSIYNNNNHDNHDGGGVTIISGPFHSWIFKYVFGLDHVFSDFRDSSMPIKTKNVILVVDSIYRYELRKVEPEDEKQIELLKNVYNNTKTIAVFKNNNAIANNNNKEDYNHYYPYSGLKVGLSSASGVEIRSNY